MVIDVSPKKKAVLQNGFSIQKLWLQLKTAGSVPQKEKLFFVKNLQVMIKSGMALDKSLKALASQTRNKRFQMIIAELAESTEKGLAFADSLKKYENIFGKLMVNMVEAGEISGKLEDVLTQIYNQLKKLHELRSKIISAMTYPVIVVCAMILIGIGMLIFVIPKITSLFDQFSAELPVATKALIAVSDFIVNNGFFSFLIAVSILASLIITLRQEKTKKFWHWLYLNTPILGPIVKKINIAKFCRTVSSLMKADIAITKTFETTAMVVGNYYYRQSLQNSIERLKSGVSITDVLNAYPKLYPPVVTQMVASGEETGEVDTILEELADFYEEEIDATMKTLPTIIEPVLMLILGVGVGLMAVAIIMPMYTITQHIN